MKLLKWLFEPKIVSKELRCWACHKLISYGESDYKNIEKKKRELGSGCLELGSLVANGFVCYCCYKYRIPIYPNKMVEF